MYNRLTGIRMLKGGVLFFLLPFFSFFLWFSFSQILYFRAFLLLFFWFYQALFQAFSLTFSNKKHEENWMDTPIFTRAIYQLI